MGLSATVSEHDLRAMLDVVSPDAVASDGPELPEQVLRGLAELIPCCSVSFYVMDTRRGETHAMQELSLVEPPAEDEETTALFFDAYWDTRDCCAPELTGDHTRVTMWSDVYTEREYSRLLMGEYFRRVGIWHELLVCLPPVGGLERRLMLAREPGDLPFTERDRLLLTLLRPHLVNLRDRVEAERRTVPALTARQLELLRRVAMGHSNRRVARDLGLSEGTVRKHLENVYARLGVHSRTEALALAGVAVALSHPS
jgi:DNA-binding CsgD family transcriptional regulator